MCGTVITDIQLDVNQMNFISSLNFPMIAVEGSIKRVMKLSTSSEYTNKVVDLLIKGRVNERKTEVVQLYVVWYRVTDRAIWYDHVTMSVMS